MDRISKHYELGRQPVPVLRELSLRVSPAEIVAVMGPSGSGKTTLLNCISGIDTVSAGSIRVGDVDLTTCREHERTLLRRHEIGMVFQFFNLIPSLTVRENVELPFLIMNRRDADLQERVDRMIAEMGLEGRRRHHSFQLSGGEMQLVSIARALVHRPALLLADEPTGNVNPAVGRSILEILTRTTSEQRTAVLMVTHNPEHAAWADRVCFLKDGAIAAERRQDREAQRVSEIYEQLLDLGI